MKKSVVLFEDNKQERDDIFGTLREVNKDLELIFFEQMEKAIKYLSVRNVDLILINPRLDSDYDNYYSGIYLARRIRLCEKNFITPIIFTSCGVSKKKVHTDISFCAYFERQKDEKWLTILREILLKKTEEKWVTFRVRGVVYNINLDEIIYAEVYRRIFHLKTRKELLSIPYLSMKEFIEKVSDYPIYQCHRSYAVNLEYVAYINQNKNEINFVESFGKIEMGLAYKKSILHKFQKEQ